MLNSVHVLIIDDGHLGALRSSLEGAGYRVDHTEAPEDALALVDDRPPQVILAGFDTPGIDGLKLTRRIHASTPHLPILLIATQHNTRTAIEATKIGAYDYSVHPVDPEKLIALIQQAAHSHRLMTDAVELGNQDAEQDAIIGSCPAMQEVYKQIGRIAAKPVDVLIVGETGTGKELAARAIYQFSDRSEKPFIAINCAAIPETLLESELFGHEKGAFTGAGTRRIGRFQQATDGTLFLDEIGDVSLTTQSKLLRVLQEKTIQRLGGRRTIAVNTRVIAATNRNLDRAMKDGRFRSDLYYRLSAVVIHLPPLANRREDVPDLVRFFLRKIGNELGVAQPSIAANAMECLKERPWPGNVRELENVVRKAMLAARGLTIGLEDIQPALTHAPATAFPQAQSVSELAASMLISAQNGESSDVYKRCIESVEREVVAQAIGRARHNQALAARWLGMSRPTLREKLRQYGLHPAQA